MVRCFWEGKCDCPDKTINGIACTEHTGFVCSIYKGKVVEKETDVNDIHTKVLEAIIDQFNADDKEIDSKKVEISEIGKIKPHVREVDLNADNKRFWLGQLSKIDNTKNCSMPLSCNHFQI